MKQIIKASLLASIPVIFFMIYSLDCFSYPVSLGPASSLIDSSDLVAKGEVKNKKEVGLIELPYGKYKRVLALFHMDRVIKGKEIAKDGDEINIELFESVTGRVRFEQLSQGEYCIVFLKSEAGNLRFHERVSKSKLPALREKSKIRFAEDSPKHRLVEELINIALSDEYKIAHEAIEELSVLGIKETIPYLKQLEGVKDSVVKGQSFAARIELGDFSCINDAVHYIEQVSSESGLEVQKAKSAICSAIETIRDSKIVSQLNILTEHPDELLRKSVVYALRSIHDLSSVPYFIRRLRDSNPDIRYNAVMGLAEATKKYQEWAPAIDTFHKDETQYIQRWEAWWTQEGKLK